MANLQEVVSWDLGVYQLETSDPVLGGPGGTSNKQAQALANRTAYLKQHMDDLEDGDTAAGKANKLTTARNVAIAGDITGQASFDGSANITITATYKNSGVVAGTYRSVTVDAKGNITAGTNPTTLSGYGITDALPLTGTAAAATKLATARNIALAGDVTGQADFDGTGNISITVTYKNSGVVAGTYRSVTVDAKGNITAGTNPTTLAGYGITDAVPASQKGAVNGVASLDSGGKVPIAQIPATAITDTFVVSTQAAMLALTAEIGDVAVRTDLNKSFILRVAGASTLANWQELLTPTDSVQSVDGLTGMVVIPTATEGVKGKAQIATQAEVDAGVDDAKLVTSKKLKAALDKDIAANGYPAGAPIPWPGATPPTGYLMMQGQSFSPSTYPKLASAYPSGTLPDLRGEFIRGWDNARGIDSARILLASQSDAIRNITGAVGFTDDDSSNALKVLASGAFAIRLGTLKPSMMGTVGTPQTSEYIADFDASSVVPTASENRPRNIAFNYIVRAA